MEASVSRGKLAGSLIEEETKGIKALLVGDGDVEGLSILYYTLFSTMTKKNNNVGDLQ